MSKAASLLWVPLILATAARAADHQPPPPVQNYLVLDCPVTAASPIAQQDPVLSAIINTEDFRFAIPLDGSSVGIASSLAAPNVPAYISQSESAFSLAFEKNRVNIDRMTGRFQIYKGNAALPYASGNCEQLTKRKF